jgi:RHS repeat-associated protein
MTPSRLHSTAAHSWIRYAFLRGGALLALLGAPALAHQPWTADDGDDEVPAEPLAPCLIYRELAVNVMQAPDDHTDCCGSEPVSCTDPDPIEIGSGAFTLNERDLHLPGIEQLDFAVERNYRSGSDYNGPFGRRWDSPLFRRIADGGPNTTAIFFNGRVRGSSYTVKTVTSTSVVYNTPTGSFFALTKDQAPSGSWSYHLVASDGLVQTYELQGTVGGQQWYRLAQTRDPNGNTLQCNYDANGNLTQVVDTSGRAAQIAYVLTGANAGRIASITDPAGRATSYAYDSSGNLISVTRPPTAAFPSGSTFTYGYDASSRIVWLQEPGASQPYLFNVYDSVGRVVQQQNGRPDQVVTISWSNYPLVSVTDREGYVVDYLVDSAIQRVLERRVHDAVQPSTVYTTTYQYDSERHRCKETSPLGRIEEWVFDTANASARSRANVLHHVQRASIADVPGLVHSWTYESKFNRPVTETPPASNAIGGGKSSQICFTYDALGNLTQVELPLVATLGGTLARKFGYVRDTYGRVVQETDPRGTITKFEYDPALLRPYHTSETRDSGGASETIERTYDSAHRLTREVGDCACSSAPDVTYTWDQRDNMLSKTVKVDATHNHTTTFAYDATGELVQRRVQSDSPVGDGWQTTTWQLDLLHFPIAEIVENGTSGSTTTTFTYDKKQRRVRTDAPTGRAWVTAYDERSLVKSTTSLGDPATTADDITFTAAYDADSLVTSSVDSRGKQRQYLFDGYRRPLLIESPLHDYAVMTWNANGKPLTESVYSAAGVLVDERIQTWNLGNQQIRDERLHVDRLGNPIGDGRLTVDAVYDLNGNLARYTYEDGTTYTQTHDGLDRLVSVRDSLASANGVDYEYDAAGRMSRMWYVEGSSTAGAATTRLVATFQSYDARGRLLSAIDGLGNTIAREWTLDGNLSRKRDLVGRWTGVERDELGRVITQRGYANTNGIASAADVVSRYQYDGDGQLTRVTAESAANQLTDFTYDRHGLQRSIRYADGTQEDFQYDLAGNLSRLSDPNGSVLDYAYDDSSRLVGVAITRGANVLGSTYVNFVRDTLGREIQAENDGYVVTRGYNSLGSIETETVAAKSGGFTSTVGGVYSPSGRLDRIHYPSHTTGQPDYVSYTFDGAARMLGIQKTEGTTQRTVLDYAWQGNLVTGSSGPLRNTQIGFDAGGRPMDVWHKVGTRSVARQTVARDGEGNPLRNFRAFYDSTGTALPIGVLDGGIRYQYDSLDQLVSSVSGLTQADLDSGSSASQKWTQSTNFDRVHNRQNQTTLLFGQPFAYDQYVANSVNEYTVGGPVTATYDANGSLRTNSAGQTIQYDFINRPVSIVENGVTLSIAYDPFGRRIRTHSTYGPQEENLTYWGWQAIEQRLVVAGYNFTREFVYGRGLDEVVEMRDVATNSKQRYFLDIQGNPIALVDDSGTISESYRYLDHGRRFHFSPSTGALLGDPNWFGAQPVGYQGRWIIGGREDLIDFRFRTYLPNWGRFAQPDPLGFPDGLMNRYQYAGGNPHDTDPYGLKPNIAGTMADKAGAQTHVGQTRQALNEEGFTDAADIEDITWANWNQDEGSSMLNTMSGEGQVAGVNSPKNNTMFHAIGSEETRKKYRRFWEAQITLKDPCNKEILGQALHFAQDLIYHVDENGKPYENECLGHGVSTGLSDYGTEIGVGTTIIAGILGFLCGGPPGAAIAVATLGPSLVGGGYAVEKKAFDPDRPTGAEAARRHADSVHISKDFIKMWKKQCGPNNTAGRQQKFENGKPIAPTTGGKGREGNGRSPTRTETPTTGGGAQPPGKTGSQVAPVPGHPGGPTTGGPAGPTTGGPSGNGDKNKARR